MSDQPPVMPADPSDRLIAILEWIENYFEEERAAELRKGVQDGYAIGQAIKDGGE